MNANDSEPLDFQQIRGNSLITLRVPALKHLGAKRDDWIVVLPGENNTLIIKRVSSIHFDYKDPPGKSRP